MGFNTMDLVKAKVQCTHGNGWKCGKIKKAYAGVCSRQNLKTVTFKFKRHISLNQQ